MDIRITSAQEPPPRDIANAWGARLQDRLAERYSGRFTVDWTEDKTMLALTPPAIRQWLTLQRGNTFQGRIGLVWDHEHPGRLQIRTEVDPLPRPDLPIKNLFDLLGLIMGVIGFGIWVWFAVVDWHRIWNRVSSFGSGYDATHATKLEVLWLLVGWGLTPAIGVGIAGLIRAQIETVAAAWQRRRVQAFTRKDLGQTLEAMVQNMLKEASLDPKACLALGQAHIGEPHPVHPNLVWSAKGQYKPAEGFTWASDDPDSLTVAPKPE